MGSLWLRAIVALTTGAETACTRLHALPRKYCELTRLRNPSLRSHRDGPDGTQHNLYYHILLKKVLPMPVGLGPAGGMPQGMAGGTGPGQLHAGMALPAGGPTMQMPPLPLPLQVPRRGM